MEKSFWANRWQNNQIGFHELEANPVLIDHIDNLSLEKGCRIFVPLCGKTLDIAWLLSQGYKVVGAEIIESAIEQLFDELSVQPTIARNKTYSLYQAENIDILVGDIFDLALHDIGHVDGVYDRAAFVAMPDTMRKDYVSQVAALANYAPQLLVTYEYDQSLADGPPFSSSTEQVIGFYQEHYSPTLLKTLSTNQGVKGLPSNEYIWLLRP
jgi:thiopurine S-methyltransferase